MALCWQIAVGFICWANTGLPRAMRRVTSSALCLSHLICWFHNRLGTWIAWKGQLIVGVKWFRNTRQTQSNDSLLSRRRILFAIYCSIYEACPGSAQSQEDLFIILYIWILNNFLSAQTSSDTHKIHNAAVCNAQMARLVQFVYSKAELRYHDICTWPESSL